MNDLDKCIVCGQTLYLVPSTETPVRYCGDKCRTIAELKKALNGLLYANNVVGGPVQALNDARALLLRLSST